jgi:hypothetical protein
MSLLSVVEVIPTMQKPHRTQTRGSISSYRVLLKGAPVLFKSFTQKSVELLVCEAEQLSGVLYAHKTCYTARMFSNQRD